MKKFVLVLVCLLMSAVYSGCFGTMAARRSEAVAAEHHPECPRDQVRYVRGGGHWQYWINVCGDMRLYSAQDARYEDITHTVR